MAAGSTLRGRRIAVLGTSGAGKSSLARALAGRLGIPHVELDALHWLPGWRALPAEDPGAWRRVVAEAIAGEGWVTDGNYGAGALTQILPLATDVVWLDYSRAVVMARVLRRSFWRALLGRELWPGTGNRETFLDWFSKHHPIRWSWDSHRGGNATRQALFEGPGLAHARKHHLRRPGETRRWLAGIPPG